jgi:hypothetical protein
VILQAVASLVVCLAAVTAADERVEQVTQQSQELETAETKPKRSIGGGTSTHINFLKVHNFKTGEKKRLFSN